jgi:alkanesulfonate monooxygenase SsuD/methylene tetrahydromethanopterin reductase-like flavin-dependent oxidoreductase (luciferase family)
MFRFARDVEKARHDTRAELDRIKAAFGSRQAGDKDRWNAAKESFTVPLSRYREVLGGMYKQVLAQIEDYNRLAKEADQFRGLVPGDAWERAVKESVPENWYDRIYFDGYNRGYSEGTAFERLSRVPQVCENPR